MKPYQYKGTVHIVLCIPRCAMSCPMTSLTENFCHTASVRCGVATCGYNKVGCSAERRAWMAAGAVNDDQGNLIYKNVFTPRYK